MKKLLYAFMFIILSSTLYAQSTSSSIFRQGDEIRVELSGQSDYFYLHDIEKGHSLYALSKIFNIPLQTLYSYNQLQAGAVLNIGQRIKIPLKDDSLFKGVSLDGLTKGHFIPVYYKTKPKDNLFRISRVYFKQPTEDLVKRNKLTSNNLDLGQDLLIGWFPINTPVPIVHEEEFEEEFDLENDSSADSDIYFMNNSKVENDILNESEDIDTIAISPNYPAGFNPILLGNLMYSESMKEIRQSEVANWDDKMPDNGMVYVLHKNAIIDSYVEMYNPVRKRSVKAKVIGRIPYGAYTTNVSLVLSPRAAIQLGALDKRFKVEVKALVFNNATE